MAVKGRRRLAAPKGCDFHWVSMGVYDVASRPTSVPAAIMPTGGVLRIILGRNGSGNDYFWLKTDRLKKYFRPEDAQTGLKLKLKLFNIFLPKLFT
jgi:hypothetical protein